MKAGIIVGGIAVIGLTIVGAHLIKRKKMINEMISSIEDSPFEVPNYKEQLKRLSNSTLKQMVKKPEGFKHAAGWAKDENGNLITIEIK